MKRLGIIAFSVFVALALLFGSASFVKATIIQTADEITLFGVSSTSVASDVITVTPRTTNGNLDIDGYLTNSLIASIQATGWKMIFDNAINKLTFTGSTPSSPNFTIYGTLSDYAGPPISGNYYSWNVIFNNLSDLNNSYFDTKGAYKGAISIQQAGGDLKGKSFTSGDVSNVPIPAAAWLLGSGLVGLIAVRRRIKK